ncbi:uncharacterized protein [Maniola hyperantus]|uniref:uncharacterized protein isoform X2 n=1 Tax=Aphantopus hyperantus TaxID=2795564 RepID=UPI002133389D
MNYQAMWRLSRSRPSRDIRRRPGARLVARPGRRRRRCRSAAEARARAAPPAAAPSLATTRALDAIRAGSGTAPTGSEMPHTGHRRTRTGIWRERAGSPGGSRGSCTRGWPFSHLASSCTSSAPETRVSKHQRYVWWARHSSWPAFRVACCVLCFVFSPSLVAGGGPTTRRTEDCPVAWKAKRCRWRGAQAHVRDQRSVRRRDASTRPRATCPACPAAKRTSVCVDTARPTRPPHTCSRKLFTCSQRGRSQHRSQGRNQGRSQGCSRGRNRVHSQGCNRGRSRVHSQGCNQGRSQGCSPGRSQGHSQGCRRPSSQRSRRQARGRPRGTCPSRAAPTASWSSAPRSYAPNPQAINIVAILFIRTMTMIGQSDMCGGKWRSILHV